MVSEALARGVVRAGMYAKGHNARLELGDSRNPSKIAHIVATKAL